MLYTYVCIELWVRRPCMHQSVICGSCLLHTANQGDMNWDTRVLSFSVPSSQACWKAARLAEKQSLDMLVFRSLNLRLETEFFCASWQTWTVALINFCMFLYDASSIIISSTQQLCQWCPEIRLLFCFTGIHALYENGFCMTGQYMDVFFFTRSCRLNDFKLLISFFSYLLFVSADVVFSVLNWWSDIKSSTVIRPLCFQKETILFSHPDCVACTSEKWTFLDYRLCTALYKIWFP